MIRLLLMLGSLVAAPMTAWMATSPASPAVITYDNVGYPSSMGAYSLELDASAMPGEDGWFLIPVSAPRDGYVSIEAKYKQYSSYREPFGSALIVAFDRDAQVMLGAIPGSSYHEARVNADGHEVECCRELDELTGFTNQGARATGSTGGPAGPIGPRSPVWVGLIAVGWEPGSKLKVTLLSDVPITAGPAHSGDEAYAVDLVAAAVADGTNARLGDMILVGDEGSYEKKWTPSATGILVGTWSAHYEGTARLTMTAPGVTGARGETIRHEWGSLTAVGNGAFSLGLTDLHAPRFHDQLVNPQEYGAVYASAMYAEVDVPLRGSMEYGGEFEDEDW